MGKEGFNSILEAQVVTPPLILRDTSGEINAFRTANDLQNWVEEIDVSSGEYEGWDSSGRVIELDVSESGEIEIRPTELMEPDRLRQLLVAYITRIRILTSRDPRHVESLSMQQLIDEVY